MTLTIEFCTGRGDLLSRRTVPVSKPLAGVRVHVPLVGGGVRVRSVLQGAGGQWFVWLNDDEPPPLGLVEQVSVLP